MIEDRYRSLAGPRPGWFGSIGCEDKHGRLWKHGRFHYWTNAGKITDLREQEREWDAHVGAEWVVWPGRELRTIGGKISTSGEETLDTRISLGPLGRLYWNITVSRRTDGSSRRQQIRLPAARADIEVGATHIDWCFGRDDGGWSRNASWRERIRRNRLTWWRIGRHREQHEEVKSVDTTVALPEGSYPITVTLCRDVWAWEVGPYSLTRTSRRRWRRYLPFGRRVEWTAEWKSETGLPVPGKGENSWDCGPDAIFASGVKVRRPHDNSDREWIAAAAASAIKSVLSIRARYGRNMADTGA